MCGGARATQLAGRGFRLACYALDELHLLRNVRRAVCAKDLVKPDGRLAVCVRPLPGVPGQVCLCLALHQTPVNHPDIVRFADHQCPYEEAAVAARHVFGADERAFVRPPLRLRCEGGLTEQKKDGDL